MTELYSVSDSLYWGVLGHVFECRTQKFDYLDICWSGRDFFYNFEIQTLVLLLLLSLFSKYCPSIRANCCYYLIKSAYEWRQGIPYINVFVAAHNVKICLLMLTFCFALALIHVAYCLPYTYALPGGGVGRHMRISTYWNVPPPKPR